MLLHSSSCTHAIATAPAELLGACSLTSPAVTAFPVILAGRLLHQYFSRLAQRSLALRPAYSSSHLRDPLHRRLQLLRHLHNCSDYYRLERQLPGGVRTHWKSVPFHGALV